MPEETITVTDLETLLILAIQKRLADQVPELRHIDVNYSQLDHEEPPVDFPCALIDIEDVKYTNRGDHSQDGDTIICISTSVKPYSNTSSKTPLKWIEKGLNLYAIQKKIHKALHGWCPSDELDEDDQPKYSDAFSTFTRVTANTERMRIKKFHTREQRYAITIKDDSTIEVYTVAVADILVIPEIITT